MLWTRKQNFKTGTPAILFLIFYATARIVCEFFREPDQQIGYFFGWLSQGQLLSLLLIVIALVLWKMKNKAV
jgi:phosphatidylglycerol:prolipoprotein diacylglycerol transferase